MIHFEWWPAPGLMRYIFHRDDDGEPCGYINATTGEIELYDFRELTLSELGIVHAEARRITSA